MEVSIKEFTTDGQQACEKMLMLLIIKEMQIKITKKYHLTIIRMAIIIKSRSNR